MPRHKNQMWWIVSESVPTLPGVLWILQHEWVLCYRVWQLWRQKINRITRAFMKADLAGKTGEHMAGQVLSRSDRYWQWLYLGCAEIPFHHQQSAPRRAARVTAVRCQDAQLIRRWLVCTAKHRIPEDKISARKLKAYCASSAQESEEMTRN